MIINNAFFAYFILCISTWQHINSIFRKKNEKKENKVGYLFAVIYPMRLSSRELVDENISNFILAGELNLIMEIGYLYWLG